MKFILMLLCSLLNLPLGGCSPQNSDVPVKEKPETIDVSPLYSDEKNYVQPVGEVPEKFQSVIEQNLLRDIALSDHTFFIRKNDTPTYTIEKYNFNFEKTAICTYTVKESDANYNIGSVIGTEDGGFFFSLQSYSHQKPDGSWIEGNTKLVKCNAKGNAEWEYTSNGNEWSSPHLYEKNGFIYAIFDVETGTKQTGTYSATDISLIKFDQTGKKVLEKTYGGSDYDSLNDCEETDDGFELLIYTQSNDGDFSADKEGGSSWVKVGVNETLNLVSIQKASFQSPKMVGMVNGKKVHFLSNQLTINGKKVQFADGRPTAIIDYNEFYLIVSDHIVGQLEYQPPYISSIWSYSETVYGAYDQNGKLLWKATADATPKTFLEYSKKQELEKAKQDGCVVFEELHLTSGKDAWLDFVNKTEKGEATSIRIAKYYAEGPQIFFTDLSFDGAVYQVKTTEKNNVDTEEYQYLKHYTGKPREGAAFSEYDCYILVNDQNVTYEALEKSMFSSSTKDWIVQNRVYVDLKK